MLPKKRRLPIQFFVRKQSRTKSSNHLRLKIFPHKTEGHKSRFGVVVGKRVSKKATVRNRVRRAIFRYAAQKDLNRNEDYMIVAQAGSDTLSEKDLYQELDTLFYT